LNGLDALHQEIQGAARDAEHATRENGQIPIVQ
jgi:hypothetical protein